MPATLLAPSSGVGGGVVHEAPSPSVYVVQVVTMAGVLLKVLTLATAAKVRWVLNGHDSADFWLNVLDPDGAYLTADDLPGVEVQVWRDGKMLFWGPVWSGGADLERASFHAEDPGSYWDETYIGKPRHDYLEGIGNFDLDLVGTAVPTGWTRVGITDSAIVDNNIIEGTRAFQMNMDADDQDAYIEAVVEHVTPSADAPFVLSGNFYFRSDKWVGPAIDSQLLYAEARRADDSVIEVYFATGDDSSPQDAMFRPEVQVGRPAEVDKIAVRGYAAGTWSVTDAIHMVLPEALSYQKTDICEILESTSVHAQDPAMLKPDRNIGRSHNSSNLVDTVVFRFEDHISVWSALTRYVGVENGVDVAVICTPYSRTMTTFPGGRGVDRTADVVLSFVHDPGTGLVTATTNLANRLAYDVDGRQRKRSVTTTSNDSSGPSREEYETHDDAVAGGELVESVPQGMGIGHLKRRGDLRLAQTSMVPDVMRVTIVDRDLIGVLLPGDLVACEWDYGWVQIADTRRVIDLELDCASDTMDVTLNRLVPT